MNPDNREETLRAAKAKAEHYCASRECCRFDLERKFNQWEVPEEIWEDVFSHLESQGFLDEKRYIRAFIDAKFQYNNWGKIKIKHALKQKQLPEHTIEELVEELDHEEYLSVLRKLVNKKAHQVKGNNNYQKRQKVINSMTSKGFEPSLVIEVLDEENIFKI